MATSKAMALVLMMGLLGALAGFGQSPTQSTKSFKAVLQEKFDSWDSNHDGKLDPQEVDHLLHRHTFKGEEAAAIASIHIWFRGNHKSSGLTREELTAGKEAAAERRDMAQKSPHFASDYQSLAKHLNSIRKVFSDKKPQLEDLSQGHLGDCYFVSMVGAMVHRNPDSLHRIIHSTQGNGCELSFPEGKKAHVPELTDGLICLGSTARQSGLWLNVLEEGFGELAKTKKAANPGDPAIDKIGQGGSQTTTISLLTGKHAFNHSLKTLPPAKIHQLLMEGHARHYLMGAGTSKGKPLPKGIAPNHAYAILGIQGDKIQIWNPWGNHFTPKGTPGLENGYPTEKGVFTVSLHEFCSIFSDISIETAEAAKHGKK